MVKLVLPVCLILCGCATYAPITYTEQCATKGMLLDGVDTQTGSGYAVTSNGTLATAESAGENVRCSVPRTDPDKATVQNTLRIAEPKLKYNESVTTGKWLVGTGYVLYIVPGIVGKVIWDKKLNKAMDESEALRRAPASVDTK